MYTYNPCLNLGVDIKISDVLIGPSVIDPNEGCCITSCTFLLSHIISRTRNKLKKPTREPLYVFSFDDTEEKVAVKFEGEKGQDNKSENKFIDNFRSMLASLPHSTDNLSEINKKIEKSKNKFIDNFRSMLASLPHSVDKISEINNKLVLIELTEKLPNTY